MKPFDLHTTLESGQVFRYTLTETGALLAHADKVYELYFDEKKHDKEIKHLFRYDQPQLQHNHPYVAEAINNTQGIRVIRQDEWECLVAFIISQNNHQKRIQKNVLDISTFGKKQKHGFYSFPTPQELPDEETLTQLGLGYRAKHIAALKNIELNWLYNLRNIGYEQAKKELMTLNGVGPKVADCILLFSMEYTQALPEDTWIKKIYAEHNLSREDFPEHAGIIQQAIFHYARSNKL